MKLQYPAIYYFSSVYLNQDFDVMFGSFDGALVAYCQQEPLAEQQELMNDIEKILDSEMREQKLQHLVLKKFDCQFNYLLTFENTSEWLRYILNVVRDSVAESADLG